MIFRDGITESARNERVRNGVSPAIRAPRRRVAGAALLDHRRQRCVGHEAGDGERALGQHADTVDGDDASADLRETVRRERHLLVGRAEHDEVVRVVRRRVEASAPRCSPEPETKPRPDRARSPGAVRSPRSSRGRARDRLTARPSSTVGSRTSDSVTTCSRTRPIARTEPSLHGIASVEAVTGAIRTDCLTQSGHRDLRHLPIGRPRLSTMSGRRETRSGSTSTSAWYPGAIAPTWVSPWHCAAIERRHHERVLGADRRLRPPLAPSR